MDLWKIKKIETKRGCKRKRLSNIESLPDDVVFEILQHLPLRHIYEAAMLVCRKWYNIIRTNEFIYANLHRSTPGILIKHFEDAVFLTIGQGNKIKISKLSYEFDDSVLCSCNGLILKFNSKKKHDRLHISNPFTKQKFAIPPLYRRIKHKYFEPACIGYAASSMVYKVVLTYTCEDEDPEEPRCAMLTVGVDESWRLVSIEHLSDTAKDIFSITRPFITEGFMHWSKKNGPVLTLNVETEIITENPIPRGYGLETFKYYLSTGRSSLSLLVSVGEFSFDVWDMKSKTGEWTKLYKIDLENQYQFDPMNECPLKLIPVGWLRNQEVLVLHNSRDYNKTCIAYNVRMRQIMDYFELDYDCTLCTFELHKNSLVWLAGS